MPLDTQMSVRSAVNRWQSTHNGKRVVLCVAEAPALERSEGIRSRILRDARDSSLAVQNERVMRGVIPILAQENVVGRDQSTIQLQVETQAFTTIDAEVHAVGEVIGVEVDQ